MNLNKHKVWPSKVARRDIFKLAVFTYFRKSNLGVNSTAEEFYSHAQKMINQKKEFFYDNTEHMNDIAFYDQSLYEFAQQCSKKYMIDIITTMTHFHCAVRNILGGFDPSQVYTLSAPSVHQASPPEEAYKYRSFNKMDIKFSTESYALLFERD